MIKKVTKPVPFTSTQSAEMEAPPTLSHSFPFPSASEALSWGGGAGGYPGPSLPRPTQVRYRREEGSREGWESPL